MKQNQKIFAGVFYYDDIDADLTLLQGQVNTTTRGWNAIYAVSIGNEWVQDGKYSASTVSDAVSNAKTTLQKMGYTGDVVTVDTVGAVTGNKDLFSN
ncbi:unnamed protein product [Ambrosiozyma monospora]|uniref:Unnamed protein product n=1 Tax=Ambrosiozyma monospora TaxID=43982 RepID=A0ACB5UCI3_AMBMO|nr:unnamed protein product [Ambrosiozyma monospora]